MEDTYYTEYFESPLGWMEIRAGDTELHSILFRGKIKEENSRANALTSAVTAWLGNYFRGNPRPARIPLEEQGTHFQRRVLQEVLRIPFGERRTYQELANQLGHPHAVRAVGAANGHNRILVLIPCHRVTGADGSLVGYAGELWRKKWLLEHEARCSGKGQLSFPF